MWEPRVMGLPRNGKHGLCMYNYLALGSHATVPLNESPHCLALISHLSALHRIIYVFLVHTLNPHHPTPPPRSTLPLFQRIPR